LPSCPAARPRRAAVPHWPARCPPTSEAPRRAACYGRPRLSCRHPWGAAPSCHLFSPSARLSWPLHCTLAAAPPAAPGGMCNAYVTPDHSSVWRAARMG
jgi:hypothetical protein